MHHANFTQYPELGLSCEVTKRKVIDADKLFRSLSIETLRRIEEYKKEDNPYVKAAITDGVGVLYSVLTCIQESLIEVD